MPFCIICSLRKSQPGQQYPLPSDLTTELEGQRKFTLKSLMALVAISAISGCRTILPVLSTLLIYTISLHVSINTCFLRNFPALSRLLHVIPLLGASCTAGVVFVSDLQAPAFAAIGLLLGALPLVTIAIHHRGRCANTPIAELPMRIQDVSASAIVGATETTNSS